ncbi:membrane protein [Clostridia bacterium]|nr:membrane protein [Clostridia bacterium]
MVIFTYMRQAVRVKFKESLSSVLPITGVVALLCLVFVPIRLDALLLFLFGALLLTVGLAMFSLGADMAITRMGERVGAQATKSRNLWLIIVTGIVVGFFVTIAEPDVQVLADKIAALPSWLLTATIAAGVGVSLALALYRTVKGWSLRVLLIISYAIVIALSFFVPADFIPASFDSGGVTTGAMTVPFIMALGVGVASVRSDGNSQVDSFGLVGVASIGPIFVMLLLGLIMRPDAGEYSQVYIPNLLDSTDLFNQFAHNSVHYFKEVSISLLPIIGVYIIFQLIMRGAPQDKHDALQMLVGVGYTYLGLVIFLTGVNVGFSPAGTYIGEVIGGSEWRILLIPLGFVIGFFIVLTEPAVHVLVKQVDEMTEGQVSVRSIRTSLSIGVGVSVALSMVRVLTGMSLYYIIIPGYVIALAMSFFSPKLITAIAFDSGGVASGPLTATFLLPFSIGACSAVGGNVALDAFGMVSLVALTPIIAIQTMGIVSKKRADKTNRAGETISDDIIELVVLPTVTDYVEKQQTFAIESKPPMSEVI